MGTKVNALLNYQNRLQILSNRRERLISLNQRYGYMWSNKADQYLRVMKMIKSAQYAQMALNREANNKVSELLNATKGLSGFQILMHSK